MGAGQVAPLNPTSSIGYAPPDLCPYPVVFPSRGVMQAGAVMPICSVARHPFAWLVNTYVRPRGGVELVKEDVSLRLHAVQQHLERGARSEDLCKILGITDRTLRRRCRNYREEGVEGLRGESRRPRRSPRRVHDNLANRIRQLRRSHLAGGALRIHALLTRRGVRVSSSPVHRLLKRHGFLVRIVKKPKPFKRFQRRNVDFALAGGRL